MLYPAQWLERLGQRLMQIDFIGPRYLMGSHEPCHFLSCKYVRPWKQHLFLRIPAQTSTQVLNAFYQLFFVLKLPLPTVIQMDNDSAFRGFIERKSCVGRVVRWLCANRVIPVFNATSSPWNNGSVEGGNSIFDKKFWQQFRFKTVQDLDEKLQTFNDAYATYLRPDQQSSEHKPSKGLIDPRPITHQRLKFFTQPNLYLLRIVKEHDGKCFVEALNNYILVPAKLKG